MTRDRPAASRRAFLGGAAAFAGLHGLAFRHATAASAEPIRLVAGPATAPLMGPDKAPARVWGYNGEVPGPVLRVPQGTTLALRFENALPQASTVHWHGIRIDNAMDGVAGLTQEAVPPGGAFDYRFLVPDAGTFWYHPHSRSWEQLARGLYGLLIVDEAEPPAFDRELVFLADDWRLTAEGAIDEASFGHMRDWSHAGRLGNWLTINGRSQPDLAVKAGERVRIRLANTATARVMTFRVEGHAPQVIALDGQPVQPHRPAQDLIVLAPGARCDLAVDMALDPGSEAPIFEVSHRDPLLAARLVYDPTAVVRSNASDAPLGLPDNPLAKDIALAGALRAPLVMTGGAMGRMESAVYQGETLGIRELVAKGQAWAFNGVAGRTETPLFEAERGRTVVVEMANETRWPHAIHLHGHHVQEISRNGRKPEVSAWRDVVLLDPEERVEAAFVADNPGKWMIHCHMLEHQAAGMASWFKVL